MLGLTRILGVGEEGRSVDDEVENVLAFKTRPSDNR